MTLLDCLPVLLCLSVLLSLSLVRRGERGPAARVLPAVSAALTAALYGQPPRIQVLCFLGMYLFSAVVWGIVQRIPQRRTHRHFPQNRTGG